MNSNDIETLAKQHLSIWSEKNPDKRNALIKIVYAEDVNIIDPFFEIKGHSELNQLIEDLQKKNPGYFFTLSKPIESHHNIGRIFWQFGPASKPDANTGQDVFVIAGKQIQTLYVFIDGLKK